MALSPVQAQVAAQQPDTVRRERVRGVQYASPEEAAAALAAEKRVPLWAGVSVSADLCGALMAACTPYGQYEAAARLNGMNPVRSVNGFTPNANGAVDVKVSGAGDGQVAVFDASGKLVTSGRSFWAFTRATMSLSGTTLTITTVE